MHFWLPSDTCTPSEKKRKKKVSLVASTLATSYASDTINCYELRVEKGSCVIISDVEEGWLNVLNEVRVSAKRQNKHGKTVMKPSFSGRKSSWHFVSSLVVCSWDPGIPSLTFATWTLESCFCSVNFISRKHVGSSLSPNQRVNVSLYECLEAF